MDVGQRHRSKRKRQSKRQEKNEMKMKMKKRRGRRTERREDDARRRPAKGRWQRWRGQRRRHWDSRKEGCCGRLSLEFVVNKHFLSPVCLSLQVNTFSARAPKTIVFCSLSLSWSSRSSRSFSSLRNSSHNGKLTCCYLAGRKNACITFSCSKLKLKVFPNISWSMQVPKCLKGTFIRQCINFIEPYCPQSLQFWWAVSVVILFCFTYTTLRWVKSVCHT